MYGVIVLIVVSRGNVKCNNGYSDVNELPKLILY